MNFIPICILAVIDDDDCKFMQTLYVEHSMMMYRIAHQFTHSVKDIDDIVNGACESLVRQVERLRTMDAPSRRAYVMSAVRSHALMTLRKQRSNDRTLQRFGEATSMPRSAPDPDFSIIQQVTLQEVVQAIRRLPGDDQDILRMKFFEGFSTTEIAAFLGMQQSTIRSRIRRARIRLRAALQEIQDEQ